MQVLIPFVLAMGLFYSLVPIVDFLAIKPSGAFRKGGRSGRGDPRGTVQMACRRRGRSDSDDFKSLDEPEFQPPLPLSTLKALHPFSYYMLLGLGLVKHRLPRVLAVTVALIFACAVIAAIMVVVVSSVNELAGHADKYTTRVRAMVQWVLRWGATLDVSNADIVEKLLDHTGFLSEARPRPPPPAPRPAASARLG